MRATLKSADGEHEFDTVVSDPPPVTLKKHKALWQSRWWGGEDLPLYAADQDILHFKLASVIKDTRAVPHPTPDRAIYLEVGLHEAQLARKQETIEAEKVAAFQKQMAAHAVEAAAKFEQSKNSASAAAKWWQADHLPTLEERNASSNKALLEIIEKKAEGKPEWTIKAGEIFDNFDQAPQEESAIPAPEEPKRRLMRKSGSES